MKKSMKEAIETCRGSHCSECPLRELTCIVLEEELEEELTNERL